VTGDACLAGSGALGVARRGSPACASSPSPQVEVGCTTSTGAAGPLPQVHQTLISVPGAPFGVVSSADGDWSFVALPTGIEVLSDRSPVPTLRYQVPLSVVPLGEDLTPDGRYLLAADDRGGAAVVDVAAAETGSQNPVVGVLSSGGQGAIEVTTSDDGRFAFVCR
jgi:hypothetical protein